ncbi:MAG TPA: DUF1841 family protein [Steroidobacteraceae bacterium]|nr:DUF1841 family protein [Steroidobacteraceae bacterium]
MTLGGYTRDELRQSYSDAWKRRLAGSPLTPLESMIADVIERHPQYQALVADPQAARALESTATEHNPFLHMGLHLAVREQLSIDRPPGIRELHRSLTCRLGGEHSAEHALMESLAQALWEAQRATRAPDEARYLELVRSRLGALGAR